MSERKTVKNVKSKTSHQVVDEKKRKKLVKVSSSLQNIIIPHSNEHSVHETTSLIADIRSIPGFMDLSDVTMLSESTTCRGGTSMRMCAELNPIKNLVTKYQTTKNDLMNTKLMGMFVISPDSHRSDTRVHVHVNLNDKNTYYFQFADLPKYLWYQIVDRKDLDRFLQRYMNPKPLMLNLESSTQQHSVRYDLRRNNNFHPIMLERYMVTNTFTDNYVWGPVVNNENIIDVIASMSSFDMATKYYDMMQQYEDLFILCTTSRYSRSTVAIQISAFGTVADVCYVPDKSYRDKIAEINKEIDADFDLDLPIDIVLFLLPFAPVSQRFYVKTLNHDETKNSTDQNSRDGQMVIDDEIIGMVYRLNHGIMKPTELISLMKRFYKKISANKKNRNDRDIEGEYMIDIIKNYVTREYVDIIEAEKDDMKIAEMKEDECLEKNEDKKSKKDCTTQIENDSSDGDSDEEHAIDTMNQVIKMMTDNGDKKFIDKFFLKRKFCNV